MYLAINIGVQYGTYGMGRVITCRFTIFSLVVSLVGIDSSKTAVERRQPIIHTDLGQLRVPEQVFKQRRTRELLTLAKAEPAA